MKHQSEFQPGQHYHVVMKANNHDLLFKDSGDKTVFLDRICRFILPCAEVTSFVLMDNHVHLLLRVHPEQVLRKLPIQLHLAYNTLTAADMEDYLRGKTEIRFPKETKPYQGSLHKLLVSCIRGLKISYKSWYNNKYQASGTLWSRKKANVLLPNEEDVYRTIAYIHNNPVQHGIVEEAGDVQFSSYTEIISGKSKVLRPSEVLRLFQSVEDFIGFHREANPVFGKKSKLVSDT